MVVEQKMSLHFNQKSIWIIRGIAYFESLRSKNDSMSIFNN